MAKILYYNNNELCTEINYLIPSQFVSITNHTDNLLHRAFGIKESVTWADLEDFLESRCFPRTRDKKKLILDELGLDEYDPWLIVKKTEGRMAEDNQWLRFED